MYHFYGILFQLCDILGFDELEFIMVLLEKRNVLIQSAKTINIIAKGK